jgi:hypothetical protein
VAKTNQANKSKQQAKSTSKSKSSAKKEVKKRRGGVLSFLIILIGVHAIFASYLGYTSLNQYYEGQRSGMLALFVVLSLADIVAAVGMWLWKQWAIYLYITTTVVLTAFSIVLTGSVWVSFYQMLPVAILGYVINLQNKQKLFT